MARIKGTNVVNAVKVLRTQRDRSLAVEPGDLLAIRSAGAYGFTMSSNYNTRPRAAEVMVDGTQAHVVREREVIRDRLRELEANSDAGVRLAL